MFVNIGLCLLVFDCEIDGKRTFRSASKMSIPVTATWKFATPDNAWRDLGLQWTVLPPNVVYVCGQPHAWNGPNDPANNTTGFQASLFNGFIVFGSPFNAAQVNTMLGFIDVTLIPVYSAGIFAAIRGTVRDSDPFGTTGVPAVWKELGQLLP
jgi:hypothetical protein